ncbi:HMA domain-containing protein [Heracleum sosnowskyi]|uniref:HMA domain-containing protein n=1 Tax=Heracleum sosnowskyi TaxID=360622 RepID=A0AAD8MLV5_9APIA|nr:HMA domain-containing protein [Heracleum sosnowskyi]
MKKFILKLEVEDGRDKRKAMKIVSTLPGIDMISMDMKDKKLTITGTVDPVSVVSKLRKFWKSTDIISVGPAKEPEKKEEPKKEEPKKEEAKKEEPKKEEAKKEEPKKEEGKEEPKKEEEAKKEEPKKAEEPKKEEGEKKTEQPQVMVPRVLPYRPYYPPGNTYYPPVPVVEESPSTCVIC